MREKEYNYRQYLAAKSLYLAIKGEEEKSEALRFFLRKNAENDDKEIRFPTQNVQVLKKAA